MNPRWFKDTVTIYDITEGDFGDSETVSKAGEAKGLYQSRSQSASEEFGAESTAMASQVFFRKDPGITPHQYLKVVTAGGATRQGRVLTSRSEGPPGREKLWIVEMDEQASAPVSLP